MSERGGASTIKRMKVWPARPSGNLPIALYPSSFLIGSRSINVETAIAVTPYGIVFLIHSDAMDTITASLNPIEHLSSN